MAQFLERFRRPVKGSREYVVVGKGSKIDRRKEEITRAMNLYLNYKGKRNAELAKRLIHDPEVMKMYQERLQFYEGHSPEE